MIGTIGVRLKEALNRRHVSQKDLAQKTGLTEATISRYVNNQRGDYRGLIKICKELNVSADYLLGLKNDEK